MNRDKYEIIKLDVLDTATLRKYGYNPERYYVGPWAFMEFLTKIRNFLEKFGIKFPFNPCAFKHDILYNIGGSIWWKMKVDFVFMMDMIKIIYSTKELESYRKRLLIRALLFYFIVVLATPVYIWRKNWRLKENDKTPHK